MPIIPNYNFINWANTPIHDPLIFIFILYSRPQFRYQLYIHLNLIPWAYWGLPHLQGKYLLSLPYYYYHRSSHLYWELCIILKHAWSDHLMLVTNTDRIHAFFSVYEKVKAFLNLHICIFSYCISLNREYMGNWYMPSVAHVLHINEPMRYSFFWHYGTFYAISYVQNH